MNHAEMKKALKILSENPVKIEEAKDRYKTRMAEIKAEEAKGIWAPNTIKEWRSKALADRDRVCHTLAHAMRPALDYVKEHNDFTAEAISLDNSKLQNALSMIGLMGKRMTYTDQAGLISQFAGDPASLRVLEAAFSKNGQEWAAKNAREMQKPISQNAIAEMEQVLAFHDYYEERGELSFPLERAFWSKSEFGKLADRFGYDLAGVPDPYILALDTTLDGLEEQRMHIDEADPEQAAKTRAYIDAQRYKVAKAKREIEEAKAKGTDPGEAFNTAMRSVEG